ncbi:hypothetical protein TWF718_000408 [Orbilia javanica]|uniref:Uncharacterized protein n=1 Tax=Orbilia javanica TaxID=47235 RepID=A0AAN8NC73_9PEZI
MFPASLPNLSCCGKPRGTLRTRSHSRDTNSPQVEEYSEVTKIGMVSSETTALDPAPSTQAQPADPKNEPVERDQLQPPNTEAHVQQVGDDGQTSKPPEQRYSYEELLQKKKHYKRRLLHYRGLSDELDEENEDLYQDNARLKSLLDNHATKLSSLEEQNSTLKSSFDGAPEFLQMAGFTDFLQAKVGWSSGKKKLEEKQEQVDKLRSEIEQAREQSSNLEGELKQTQQQFVKLQDEVLGCVERFDPSFDSQVLQGFLQLNNGIGKLAKSRELREVVLGGDPLTDWGPHALWKGSFNPTLSLTDLSDLEKRLLLRQAIWKFISGRLLDRAHPFASFGGPVGELASRFHFDKLFPDHEANENAGKWRSTTVRQLAALQEVEGGDQSEENFLKELVAEFSVYIKENLVIGAIKLEELDSVLSKGPLNKRLKEVFERSVRFSRLIMKERAAFTVGTPNLEEMGYLKSEDDDLTTAQGVVVGVNDGDDLEVDPSGIIKLVGSPFLRKHGDGGGKNLDQDMIIVKAFVIID